MHLQNKNKGFTLIELVIVIVILGILAATAAPKFIDLQKEAKVAALSALMGTIESAAQMVHSKAIIDNQLEGAGSVDTNGVTINLFKGYPMIISTGIRAAIQTDFANGEWAADNGTSIANSYAVFTFSNLVDMTASPLFDEIEATNCFIKYIQPDDINDEYQVELIDTGC